MKIQVKQQKKLGLTVFSVYVNGIKLNIFLSLELALTKAKLIMQYLDK